MAGGQIVFDMAIYCAGEFEPISQLNLLDANAIGGLAPGTWHLAPGTWHLAPAVWDFRVA